MPFKFLKNNQGLSPILIVIIVLISIVVVNAISIFVFMIRDPYVLVSGSLYNMQTAESFKSSEISGELSGKLNLSKLIKNSEQFTEQGLDTLSEQIIDDLDTDSNFKVGINLLQDKENSKELVNLYIKSENFKFGEYQDFTDREGNLLNMDIFTKGSITSNPELIAVRINKLPNYLPQPDISTGRVNKIRLNSFLGSWVDVTQVSGSGLNNLPISNSTVSQETSSSQKNILNCTYKELNSVDELRANILARQIFSKSENKGFEEIDGKSFIRVDFELNSSDKIKITGILNELSAVVCSDTSNLKNEILVDSMFAGESIDLITLSYFIDPETTYMRRGVINFTFNEREVGTNLSFIGTFDLKNINNTVVEEPKNIQTLTEYFTESIRGLQSSSSNMIDTGDAQNEMRNVMCPISPEDLKVVLANCNSSNSTLGFRDRAGYCQCYFTQYQLSECNDDEGRFQKVVANCSRFIN